MTTHKSHKLITNKNNINIVIHNNLAKPIVRQKGNTRETKTSSSSIAPQYIEKPTYLNRFLGNPNPRMDYATDTFDNSIDNRIRNNNPVSTAQGSDSFHTIGDSTPSEVYSETNSNDEYSSPNPKDIYFDDQNFLLSPEIQQYIENQIQESRSSSKIPFRSNLKPFSLLSPSSLLYPSPNDYGDEVGDGDDEIYKSISRPYKSLTSPLISSRVSGGRVSKKLGFDSENESDYNSAASSFSSQKKKESKTKFVVRDTDDESDDVNNDTETEKLASSALQQQKPRRQRRTKAQMAIDNAAKEQSKIEKNRLKLSKLHDEFSSAKTQPLREKALAKIEKLKTKI